jgi:hypothetical protein
VQLIQNWWSKKYSEITQNGPRISVDLFFSFKNFVPILVDWIFDIKELMFESL